jgi:hypothetical protein
MVVEKVEGHVMEKANKAEVFLVEEVFCDVRSWQRPTEKNIF